MLCIGGSITYWGEGGHKRKRSQLPCPSILHNIEQLRSAAEKVFQGSVLRSQGTLLMKSGRSLTYKMNISSPRIERLGTPILTLVSFDFMQPTFTISSQLLRYLDSSLKFFVDTCFFKHLQNALMMEYICLKIVFSKAFETFPSRQTGVY